MPSNRAVNSPPTGGAVELSNGPLPHRLLKLNTGELSAECRSLKTRYNRNSGPKRTLWLPFIQVKVPVNVWLSDAAMPSPDSELLSVVSDPTLIFGRAVSPFGNRLTSAGENPSEARSKPWLTRCSGNSCWLRP